MMQVSYWNFNTNLMTFKAWNNFPGFVYSSRLGLDLTTFHVSDIGCWASLTLFAEDTDGEYAYLGTLASYLYLIRHVFSLLPPSPIEFIYF